MTFRAAVEAVLDDASTSVQAKIELLRDLLKEKERTTSAVEKGTSKAQEILNAAEEKSKQGAVAESKSPGWLKKSVTAILLESPAAPNQLQRCCDLLESNPQVVPGGGQQTAEDVQQFRMPQRWPCCR